MDPDLYKDVLGVIDKKWFISDLVNGYECICFEYFTGTNCEIETALIDCGDNFWCARRVATPPSSIFLIRVIVKTQTHVHHNLV